MKFTKLCILFVMLSSLTTVYIQAQTIGQDTGFSRQLNTRDDQPVREFVESKENIDVRDKAKNLTISGDVRFEWRSIREKGVVLYSDDKDTSYDAHASKPDVSLPGLHETYRQLRGGDRVGIDRYPLSVNDFDVEFNLKVGYTFERAWCLAHLQFDNQAGCNGYKGDCIDQKGVVLNKSGTTVIDDDIPRDRRRLFKGSGFANAINLKRAYVGYQVYADGDRRFDIELGRRKLDDIFVSEVQFSNRFDGILFKYADAISEVAGYYCNASAFIIDERVNHFGYVAEIGLLNILDTQLDIRYSFIDWRKCGYNSCYIKDVISYRFQNSQISASYTITPEIFNHKTPIEFYGGFLVNHAARKHTIITHNKRKNLAWYAGVYINDVNKKGDWAADIEYVVVQAQAVPDYDVGSIGRGNIYDEALAEAFFAEADSDVDSEDYYGEAGKRAGPPKEDFKAYFPRRGNSNFMGCHFQFLYALTDNLSIKSAYNFSKAEDRRIGGRHRYSSIEIETIYAF